jgi:glycosyltransferase involved in cell wall biosynthesis
MPRAGLRDPARAAVLDEATPVDLTAEPAESQARSESPPRTMGSVVIPAHDEANVIGRGLDRLFRTLDAAVEVIVVCNGCTDDTAAVARGSGHPLTVLELDEASKARALRAADEAATALPRVYLDADVLVSGRTIEALLRHLGRPGALAARPPVVFDTSSSSWVVRRFYRARSEIPAVMGSLWGAGMYALSAEGRRRFDGFPLVVADDLFVDRLFRADEIEVVDTDPVVVVAPATTGGLLSTFRRTFRGNRALRGVAPAGGRPGTRATVRDVLRLARRGPAELVDASVYAAVVIAARALAWRHPASSDHWERDGTRR